MTGLMGGKQPGFSDSEQLTAKKQTKRVKFLAAMEAVVPWDALIEPHYPMSRVTPLACPLHQLIVTRFY